MTDQPLIFLSYAREDEASVVDLYHSLVVAGFKPWLDKKDILPGEQWEHAIQQALEQAKLILICCSCNSISKSGWVQREIRRATYLAEGMLDNDIFIIPIRLDRCDLPQSLKKFQWADLFVDEGETRLLQAIHTSLARQGIQIAPVLPLTNPFYPGGKINEPQLFFGRQRLIREIRAELQKMNNFSLVGPSQIGKSSLLYYLYATRADWLSGVTIEYIDLQGILDEVDFCETVLTKLGESGDSLHDLKRILIGRPATILLFDEVERLAKPDFNPDLQNLLRSLAQEPHVAMGLATQHELIEVFPPRPDNRLSPLINIFDTVKIGPFSPAEVRAFLASRLANTSVTFTETEVEYLLTESQGHPARLQQMAKALFEDKVTSF